MVILQACWAAATREHPTLPSIFYIRENTGNVRSVMLPSLPNLREFEERFGWALQAELKGFSLANGINYIHLEELQVTQVLILRALGCYCKPRFTDSC